MLVLNKHLHQAQQAPQLLSASDLNDFNRQYGVLPLLPAMSHLSMAFPAVPQQLCLRVSSTCKVNLHSILRRPRWFQHNPTAIDHQPVSLAPRQACCSLCTPRTGQSLPYNTFHGRANPLQARLRRRRLQKAWSEAYWEGYLWSVWASTSLVVLDVTKSNYSTIPSTQMGSDARRLTNIDSVRKAVTKAEEPIPFTPGKESYSLFYSTKRNHMIWRVLLASPLFLYALLSVLRLKPYWLWQA